MNFQPKLKEVEMKNMVKNICAAMVINLCAAGHLSATENNPNNDNKFMEENLNLTQEWDKTFPQSDKVDHKKITFHNRYGITLAADLYVPKNVTGKLPAIAISGPFGAAKEQASGLYAQTLAERGFLTIAFDPSYTGESSGQPRYVASPDINTEDFSAAVDYLSTRDDVDAERIGILGICGWGGMALNAAAIDTRIKATVTATMYDMSRVISMLDLNVNFHYLCPVAQSVKLYPLFGLTMSNWMFDMHDLDVDWDGDHVHVDDGGNHNEFRIGVNLGAGAEFALGRNWAMNVEFRYQLVDDFDQGVINFGAASRF